MFTGLIQGQGKIASLMPQGIQTRITVHALFTLPNIKVGESIAVNGVCLTAESGTLDTFSAFVSAETLRRTTLGTLHINSFVNLERALCMGDALGGHIVSGHIDAMGTIISIDTEGQSRRITIEFPKELAPEFVTKGSVAIDGISLTVNACTDSTFTVNIIPETWRVTTAANWTIGTQVNLETDILGKYVRRCLSLDTTPRNERRHQSVTLEMLRENGFI